MKKFIVCATSCTLQDPWGVYHLDFTQTSQVEILCIKISYKFDVVVE